MMTTTLSSTEVLVLGAGISGLMCAQALQEAGYTVRVLEKGRGVGGRMATRRMGGARLDHGAQFFTVRSSEFQQKIKAAQYAGIVQEWHRSDTGEPRYCGAHGMTDLPKYFAASLDVHLSQRITNLMRDPGGRWAATTDQGVTFHADIMILTAPLPQAIDLLATMERPNLFETLNALRAVTYEKGLACLALLDAPSGLVTPGGLRVESPALRWIADNQQKGISPEVPAVTLLGTPAFAAEHWDTPDDIRGGKLLEAAAPYLNANVIESRCHRWGYAFPVTPWAADHLFLPELRLALAGDAFGGPRVEAAALSGLHAAAAILAG